MPELEDCSEADSPQPGLEDCCEEEMPGVEDSMPELEDCCEEESTQEFEEVD
jgi:hypothetical protein